MLSLPMPAGTEGVRRPAAAQEPLPDGERGASEGPSVIERAFAILGAFETGASVISLTALSVRTGLPKSTTLRIVRKLLELGALEQTSNGRYSVGIRMLELASLAPRGQGLRSIAFPYLEDLHRITGQHVLLAIRDRHDAVLVERLSARDAGRVRYRVGGRLPLHSTGVGRVLLAHAGPELFDSLVGTHPELSKPDAGRAVGELRVTLADVRHRGFGVASQALPEPMSSVAAPVIVRDGVVAAISVVAPTETFSTAELRPAVMAVASAISRALASRRGHDE